MQFVFACSGCFFVLPNNCKNSLRNKLSRAFMSFLLAQNISFLTRSLNLERKKKIQAFKPMFKIQETVEMKYNPKLEGNM